MFHAHSDIPKGGMLGNHTSGTHSLNSSILHSSLDACYSGLLNVTHYDLLLLSSHTTVRVICTVFSETSFSHRLNLANTCDQPQFKVLFGTFRLTGYFFAYATNSSKMIENDGTALIHKKRRLKAFCPSATCVRAPSCHVMVRKLVSYRFLVLFFYNKIFLCWH